MCPGWMRTGMLFRLWQPRSILVCSQPGLLTGMKSRRSCVPVSLSGQLAMRSILSNGLAPGSATLRRQWFARRSLVDSGSSGELYLNQGDPQQAHENFMQAATFVHSLADAPGDEKQRITFR